MSTDTIRQGRGLRIGAVSYLNTVPLVAHLPQLLPDATLTFDHPSRLADDLAAARLDLALAPSAELARHPEWNVVSTACIGCRGPVLSVKALFRTAPADVRTLALDEGSRTSAVLAQILLADIHRVRPEVVVLPLGASPDDVAADAVVVIGDRAIRTEDRKFEEVWDLGDRWRRWTDLPFVFAAWAARPGVEMAGVGQALDEARDRGRASVEAIARQQADAMGLPYALVLTYLRDHLNFQLDVGERRGLELFFQRGEALGLLPRRAIHEVDQGDHCGVPRREKVRVTR
jgi:chorismate dehydratase